MTVQPQDVASLSSIDQRSAAEAYGKLSRGQQLTSREKTALKKFEREREEQLRWKYYRSIPQKHWRQMSGRQAKVLNEQAERYGLPIGEAVIDLPKVVRSLHDFLAANAVKLAAADDALMLGSGSPALERYREERAALARLDRLQREGQLLPRDQVRDGLGRIAATIRAAGDALARQFGNEALELLVEALDDAQAEIGKIFGDADAECPGKTPAG
jgi:hypothetical protein